VTIGSFDGVHCGHQFILRSLIAGAHKCRLPAVVVTFFPHPAIVLGKVSEPHYLTMPNQRAALFAGLGLDIAITMPFTNELASLSAREFMRKLKTHLGIKQLWIGQDFVLGKDREGNSEKLRAIGVTLGYEVKTIPYATLDSHRISSSRIRKNISQGNVRRAAMLLGRNYSISGKVVHGEGRGKKLGFPTANLETPAGQLLPERGVYATWLHIGDECYPSVSSIGYNPTFSISERALRIETHILNFGNDIYGASVELFFVEYLRPEIKYNSVQDLVAQVNKDKAIAEELLANEKYKTGLST
jgi:riboflavin kinase/FMN adenylyltransferase